MLDGRVGRRGASGAAGDASPALDPRRRPGRLLRVFGGVPSGPPAPSLVG